MTTFPKFCANFIINDYMGLCNKYRVSIETISASDLSYLLGLQYIGVLTKDSSKKIIENHIKGNDE